MSEQKIPLLLDNALHNIMKINSDHEKLVFSVECTSKCQVIQYLNTFIG
jgi:hypothetical protein